MRLGSCRRAHNPLASITSRAQKAEIGGALWEMRIMAKTAAQTRTASKVPLSLKVTLYGTNPRSGGAFSFPVR